MFLDNKGILRVRITNRIVGFQYFLKRVHLLTVDPQAVIPHQLQNRNEQTPASWNCHRNHYCVNQLVRKYGITSGLGFPKRRDDDIAVGPPDWGFMVCDEKCN